MKYAVIKIKGGQYKVKEGDTIEVDNLNMAKDEDFKTDVLLYVNDKNIKIGDPFVKDAMVTTKVVNNYLSEKLHIYKFKAKTGYRRKVGFRPKKTLVRIEQISLT